MSRSIFIPLNARVNITPEEYEKQLIRQGIRSLRNLDFGSNGQAVVNVLFTKPVVPYDGLFYVVPYTTSESYIEQGRLKDTPLLNLTETGSFTSYHRRVNADKIMPTCTEVLNIIPEKRIYTDRILFYSTFPVKDRETRKLKVYTDEGGKRYHVCETITYRLV